MISKICLVSLVVLMVGRWCFAAGGEVSSASFLKLGMDARGIALGRACTAMASGSSSIYWNPAGLLKSEYGNSRFDIQTTYKSKTPWDDSYITFASAWRFRRIALGIGYVHYGVADIPEYDDNMNYYGNFKNIEQALLTGFAVDFPGLFQIGATVIALTQEYGGLQRSEVNGSLRYGVGINLGLKFRPIVNYERLEIGILLSDKKISGLDNITSVLSDRSDEKVDSTSLFINLGTRLELWHRPQNNYLSSMILLTEVEQERDFPIKLKMGIEVKAVQMSKTTLFIRVGIDDWVLEMRDLADSLKDSQPKLKDQIRRLNRKYTLGMGLQYQRVIVDYAWVREAFRNMHFITLKLVL